MIALSAIPGGLLLVQTQNLASLHGAARLTIHSAAQLAAALNELATKPQRIRNEQTTKGQRPMTTEPTFNRGPARRPQAPTPRQASDPTARNLAPISPEQAEQEADRLFPAPARLYPEKTYTVHAVSPDGLSCDLAFNDVTIEQFEKLLGQLTKRGWKA